MDQAVIHLIATNAVAILAPYISKAAETLVPKAAEDLYAAVRERFAKKPAAEEALKDLEQAPEDEDTQASVRAQLKKIMAEDETFAMQLQKLIQEETEPGKPGVSATNRGVAAGGNISGPVVTGDVGGSVSIGGSSNEAS